MTQNQNDQKESQSQAQTHHFTVHVNWEWVVLEALQRKCLTVNRAACSRELPSRKQGAGTRGYALFRIERDHTSLEATSEIFALLDRKDELYRATTTTTGASSSSSSSSSGGSGGGGIMPTTRLFPWYASSAEVAAITLPTTPALLKSSIGSGGWGLYFVSSIQDVSAIVLASAERARAHEGFIAGLARTYGGVPDWCLQELVESVRVCGATQRKPQVRAYLFYCAGHMFVYRAHEVRLPLWEEDEEEEEEGDNKPEVLSDEMALELGFCHDTAARPYNHGRNKAKTERLLLQEVDELRDAGPGIDAAMRTLARRVLAYHAAHGDDDNGDGDGDGDGSGSGSGGGSSSSNSSKGGVRVARCAIAGVDLMVRAPDLSPVVVELNNNPAMPKEDRLMSPAYRAHLVTMAGDMLTLGLAMADRDDGVAQRGGGEGRGESVRALARAHNFSLITVRDDVGEGEGEVRSGGVRRKKGNQSKSTPQSQKNTTSTSISNTSTGTSGSGSGSGSGQSPFKHARSAPASALAQIVGRAWDATVPRRARQLFVSLGPPVVCFLVLAAAVAVGSIGREVDGWLHRDSKLVRHSGAAAAEAVEGCVLGFAFVTTTAATAAASAASSSSSAAAAAASAGEGGPTLAFHCCVGAVGDTVHSLCDTVFQAPSSLTRTATSFAAAWGIPLMSPLLSFVAAGWGVGAGTRPGSTLAQGSALGPWASKAGRRSLFALALCLYRTFVLYLALGQASAHYFGPAFDVSDHIILCGAHYTLPAVFEIAYLWACAIPSVVRGDTAVATAGHGPNLLLLLQLLLLGWNFAVLIAAACIVARTSLLFHTLAESVAALAVLLVLVLAPLHAIGHSVQKYLLPRTLLIYSHTD